MNTETGKLSNPMPSNLRRAMRATEYFTLAFGSIIGVGWMVVIDDWLTRGGPVGAMLAYLVGALLLVPIVLVYGRMAQRLPESASEIAYTAAVFPRHVSFATGWIMTFAYLIVCPYEAVAIGQLAGYVFPDLNSWELYTVRDKPVYLPHLLLGIGTTAVITIINYLSIRSSTLFQNLTTFGLLGIFAVFASLGMMNGNVGNLQPLFADQHSAAGPWLSILAVLPIVPYFLMGFETIPKCAEEAATDFDPRRFVRIMLLALAVATLFYVAVIAVVAMQQPWQELEQTRFATAVAFDRAFGWPWLVQLMMLGAWLSLLKVFNGNFLAATRLLYAMGRRELLGASLGTVSERQQTPAVAILLVGGLTMLASFLGNAVLVPISEIGSLAIALGWFATCLAYTGGAGGLMITSSRLLGLCGLGVSGILAIIVASTLDWYLWLVSASWVLLGIAVWSWSKGGPLPSSSKVT